PVNLQQVRDLIGGLNVGSYKVQRIGDENTVLVFVELSGAKKPLLPRRRRPAASDGGGCVQHGRVDRG
ncbi:MAG: hypothetical protein HC850_07660, partial [Rhodomicrobium sp.]|nr:hypothetical protein [Rhodomicrobium sp.]